MSNMIVVTSTLFHNGENNKKQSEKSRKWGNWFSILQWRPNGHDGVLMNTPIFSNVHWDVIALGSILLKLPIITKSRNLSSVDLNYRYVGQREYNIFYVCHDSSLWKSLFVLCNFLVEHTKISNMQFCSGRSCIPKLFIQDVYAYIFFDFTYRPSQVYMLVQIEYKGTWWK